MSGLSPTTGISGGVSATNLTGTVPVSKGGTGTTTSTGTGSVVLGTNPVIAGANIDAGNHFVSGRVYPSLGTSTGSTILTVANTTYCTPYYGIDPITALISLAARVATAGTNSAAKFGVATMSGTTATMITTLNPTGVATNTLNTTVTGSFDPINIKGHQFYLLCVLVGATGGGPVMPTFTGGATSNLINWATGTTTSNFGSATYPGWTSAANTYSTGFSSTFALTVVTTEIPLMGVVIP